MEETCKMSQCCCPCHKMIGFLVILFGVLFLLGHFEVVGPQVVSVGWPILVILAGLKTVTTGMCKCCDKS